MLFKQRSDIQFLKFLQRYLRQKNKKQTSLLLYLSFSLFRRQKLINLLKRIIRFCLFLKNFKQKLNLIYQFNLFTEVIKVDLCYQYSKRSFVKYFLQTYVDLCLYYNRCFVIRYSSFIRKSFIGGAGCTYNNTMSNTPMIHFLLLSASTPKYMPPLFSSI